MDILLGRIDALEQETFNNETHHYAYIYGANGKPEKREISPEAYDVMVKKYSDYLLWTDFNYGYAYRSYSVQAQIEQDWGRDLAEYRDYMQTVDAASWRGQ